MKKLLSGIAFLIIAIPCIAQQLIDGFTDKSSYHPGDIVTFYTRAQINGSGTEVLYNADGTPTTNPAITIPFTYNDQTTVTPLPFPYKDGFNYIQPTYWTVPLGLKSGMYFLHMWDPNNTPIPVIIKMANPDDAEIVIVCPTNTMQAYNNAGGKSFYHSNSSGNQASPVVSFHRPILASGPGASELENFQGFLRWFSTSPYNDPLVDIVNFISDKDMDVYNEIKDAKLLIIIGHSEYWTRQARENFDSFVDKGMQEVTHDRNALILSGNTMWWQVRYKTLPLTGNPQMVCFKGAAQGYIDEPTLTTDPYYECDPLKWTYRWSGDAVLKYSQLGSIGVNWLHGAIATSSNWGAVKIISPTSPVLLTCSLCTLSTWTGTFLCFPQGGGPEADGTLMKTNAAGHEIDASGNVINYNNPPLCSIPFADPILDVAALGFYHAELIGYSYVDPCFNFDTGNPIHSFPPFLLFQKTCESGKIINVSWNNWCNPSTFNIAYPDVQNATEQMISLLYNNNLVFSSATNPDYFELKPAYQTVSYSACTTAGSIDITPCGVYLTDGFKVDLQDGSFVAKIIDCTSCSSAARLASYPNPDDQWQDEADNWLRIYPNPNSGIFTLQVQSNDGAQKNISVLNNLGSEIYHKEKITAQSTIIDLSSHPKGIYIVKVTQDGKQAVKKIVLI